MRWVEWLLRKSVRSVAHRPARRRLRVEPLEDRVVPATVTGVVFTDFNYNGTQQLNPTVANDSGVGTVGLANEAGIAGLTVTITDTLGATQSATTASDGTYTLTLNGTGPYRVVVNTPAGFVSGPVAGSNQGSVRFVAEGTSTVNLGVVRPDQYVQANPQIAVPTYVFGSQISGPNVGTPVLQAFAYSAGSNSTTASEQLGYEAGVRTTLATAQQIGTTWGLAFNENTQTVFASAFNKRHSGFGPGGPGAIYSIDRTTGAVSQLVNIASAGVDPHNTADYLTDNTSQTVVGGVTVDSGWDTVGKIGWGGLAISDDGSTLYAVNLGDRRLYIIPIANPAGTTSVAIPLPTTNGRPDTDARPFAVQFYQGRIYVGVTDTAESTITAADLDGDPTQLMAYVFSFDAANLATAAVQNLAFSLAYDRGEAIAGVTADFQPWSRGYRQLNAQGGGGFELAVNAMPWLTGIAFDATGNMTLGLRDRAGDTIGAGAFSDPARANVPINGIAVGDILRVFGNPTAGWVLENNGSGPGGTPTGTANNNLGPGGGEFYDEDKVTANPPITAAGNSQDQMAMGAVLQLPGHPDVVSTVIDPVPIAGRLFEGGLRWFDNTDGDFTKGYRLYVGVGDPQNRPSSFGKANGLGDLEVLSNPPPSTTVGDRIFSDDNNDGEQDAGELGIPGLTVNLMRGGVIVNTATTDANGLYLFTTESDGSPLRPNTNYQICVPLAQAALANRFITTANAMGVATNVNSKLVDDGLGNACINFTTGNVGQNNFDLDGGFAPRASVGDFVFNDTNGDGIQDVGELGVAGVTVRLFDANNVQVGAPIMTPSTGLYNFTGLLPGTYSIGFDPATLPAGTAFSPALQGADRTVDSDANVATGRTATFTLVAGQNLTTIDAGVQTLASVGDFVFNDLNRNGLQDTGETGVAGVVVSLFNAAGVQIGASITTGANGLYTFTGLQPGTYSVGFDPTSLPANAAFTASLQGSNPAVDSDANQVSGRTATFTLVNGQNLTTIDAGVAALVASVGDVVFNDANANGIQEAGELGVAGVTVRLFDSTGAQVGTPTVSNASGLYLFSNLLPGSYSIGFDPATVPIGFVLSPSLRGTDTALDSDADPTTGRTASFTLVGNQNLRTIDAGVFLGSSLRGSVYVDGNNDGVRQTGERGIPNVPITLTGTTDIGTTVTFSTTTNATGDYAFLSLRPGTYTVTQPAQPANFVDGTDAAGTTGGSTGNDIISVVPLTAGVSSVANNFGEISTIQTLPVIDVAVTQTVSNTTPRVGEVVTIQICVTNNGPDVATNTIVGTPLPAGLQALGVTRIDQGAFDLGTLNWFIGTLQVGQMVCLDLSVRVVSAGSFVNTALVSVSNQETTLVNNRAPVTLVTPPDPAGSVSKQDFLTIAPTTGAVNPNLVGTLPLVAPAQAASAISDAVVAVGTQAGVSPLVQVFDRDTGATRFAFYAFVPQFTGGVNVAVGDLNGDGTADIVAAAGAGGGPHVRAFDGLTGQEIRSFFAYAENYVGGVNLAVADVNGDGAADIITATGAGNTPHVKVFSGATGGELYSFFAYGTDYTGGVSVSGGDLTGDGRAEIITGSSFGASHVKAFDGANGREIRSFFAYSPVFLGGVSVAAGDVDGDGRADIITGAGAGGGPHVKAFSGLTTGELRSFFAEANSFTGGVRVSSTDVNGDGIADILTAPASGGSSIVRTFSGSTLAQLDQFLANDSAYTFGVELSAV